SCDCQHRGAHNDRADSRAPQPGRRAGRSGVSGPCAAPGRVVVLTALHCWPPRRRRAGLGLRPDARAFVDGTRRFAQQITPDPGGSALTSGLGGRPLQARRLHVSSHMGPYTHYPPERTNADRDAIDDMLTELAQYTAELALQCLSYDEVKR